MLSCPRRLKVKLDCDVELCDSVLDCSSSDGASSRLKRRRCCMINVQDSSHYLKDLVAVGQVDGSRKFNVMNPETSRMVTIQYSDAPYPSVSDWANYPEGDEVYNHAFGFADYGDCERAEIVEREIPEHENLTPDDHVYPPEHIVEQNTMPRFFQDANSGLLPSSRRATATQVTGDFFIQAFNRRGWMISAPPLRGGFNSDIFSERIAVALGSEENRGQFVLLERNLNELKKNRMLHMLLSPLFHEYITTNVPGWSSSGYNKRNIEALLQRDSLSIDLIVSIFRNLVGVFIYLNHDRVNSRMITTANDIREQLDFAQALWNGAEP